jgi:hypothetical protein
VPAHGDAVLDGSERPRVAVERRARAVPQWAVADLDLVRQVEGALPAEHWPHGEIARWTCRMTEAGSITANSRVLASSSGVEAMLRDRALTSKFTVRTTGKAPSGPGSNTGSAQVIPVWCEEKKV